MQIEFEDLARAKVEYKKGRIPEARAHAVTEWDRLFRLTFRLDPSDAKPQQLERRYKKIPRDSQPRWELIRRLMDLRRVAASGERDLDAEEVAELIGGMDAPGPFGGVGPTTVSERTETTLLRCRKVGDDVLYHFTLGARKKRRAVQR